MSRRGVPRLRLPCDWANGAFTPNGGEACKRRRKFLKGAPRAYVASEVCRGGMCGVPRGCVACDGGIGCDTVANALCRMHKSHPSLRERQCRNRCGQPTQKQECRENSHQKNPKEGGSSACASSLGHGTGLALCSDDSLPLERLGRGDAAPGTLRDSIEEVTGLGLELGEAIR